MTPYQKEIEVRWADCDPNRHVRHSAFYDYGAHVRIRYFASIGFSAKIFETLHMGPVLFKEECTFLKELKIEDSVIINVLKGEISQDGSRWILHHEIYNGKQEKCAHLSVKGAWMDIEARKLCTPPAEIASAMHDLVQGKHYVYKSKSQK